MLIRHLMKDKKLLKKEEINKIAPKWTTNLKKGHWNYVFCK